MICSICKLKNPLKGFPCNHNICDACLTYNCCCCIYEFFSQYQLNQEKIKDAFNYLCPFKNCNKTIKVPTIKILKNLKQYLDHEETRINFEIFRGILQVLENWIPYFDGLPYDLIFFQ